MSYGIRALSHEKLAYAYSRAWAIGAWETINAIRREIDRRKFAEANTLETLHSRVAKSVRDWNLNVILEETKS